MCTKKPVGTERFQESPSRSGLASPSRLPFARKKKNSRNGKVLIAKFLREAWDEHNLTNNTGIFRSFRFYGKRGIRLRIFIFSQIFSPEWAVPFTFPTENSGFSWQTVNAQDLGNPMGCFPSWHDQFLSFSGRKLFQSRRSAGTCTRYPNCLVIFMTV